MTDTATISDQARQNIALLQRHLDAINAWDFATMRELLHPDVSLELPFVVDPFPTETRGLEAVMAFMESVPEFAEAENLHDFSIHAFTDDPNELVAEYSSDMKLTSGRDYTNTYVVRVTVKDGKLIRFCEYFDSIRLLVAVGGSVALPAEG